jgi:hypothetical protein
MRPADSQTEERESPFRSPSAASRSNIPHEVGFAGALFGVLLWAESMLIIAVAAWIQFAANDRQSASDTFVALLVGVSGASGAVAGFRLSARHRARGWLVLPLLLHGLIFIVLIYGVVKKTTRS